MPELDGVSIIGLASFAILVVAWLFAPNETVKAVKVSPKMVREVAAA